MLVYLLAIWSNVRPFGKCSVHLVYVVFIWYLLCSFGILFPVFGMFYKEKSGNPAFERCIYGRQLLLCRYLFFRQLFSLEAKLLFSKTMIISKEVQGLLLTTLAAS
jgi:hypothetical protein